MLTTGLLTLRGRVASEDDVLLENSVVSSSDVSRFRFKVLTDAAGRTVERRGAFGPAEGRGDLSLVDIGRGVSVVPTVPLRVLVNVAVRLLRREGPASVYGPVPILGILLFVCLSTAIFETCGF